MNPKMKSAIEKITLNDATFSNEVIEPTYVNFFYGKNGAGKSTIARTFKAKVSVLGIAISVTQMSVQKNGCKMGLILMCCLC